jgi:Cu2+-exporting ATPase
MNLKKIKSMKKIIPVKGMGCAKCKARVENALNALAGVNEASVSLEDAQAVVDYDPAKTSLEQMRAEVENAGYQLIVEEAK